MEQLTSAINVQVNAKDKELATSILKNLGLNMSTAINMFIKQIIKKNGIPFEVTNQPRVLEALQEGETTIQEVREGKRTGYNNVNEMMKAILDD